MLVSEAAAQKPEDFVLVSDYDASSMEELEAKKGQVITLLRDPLQLGLSSGPHWG